MGTGRGAGPGRGLARQGEGAILSCGVATRTVVIVLLAAGLAAPAQVVVTGHVRTLPDLTPLPDANVLAVAGAPPVIVGQAATDAQGRFRLELAETRFQLSIDAPGYYTVSAGGLETLSLARSCPPEGDCGEVDFVLARAPVLEGWFQDEFGNPLPDVRVELTREANETGAARNRSTRATHGAWINRRMRAITDDRGYFRIWDLRPGAYTLEAEDRGRRWSDVPGLPDQRRRIEIPPGEECAQIMISGGTDSEETFRFAGRLTGIESGDTRWVSLQRVSDGRRVVVPVARGKFSEAGVPRGEYVARLERIINPSIGPDQVSYLATLRVERDRTDLELSPQPPSGVRGQLSFIESPPGPLLLRFQEKGVPEHTAQTVELDGKKLGFERTGLLPGRYASSVVSRDYYLLEPAEFTVFDAQLADVELRISNRRASIRGTVRVAEGAVKSAAAHFTVAVRGPATVAAQTDNEGGFVFEGLIPGAYRIAAWSSLGVDVEDDAAWRELGAAVRELELEPGFDVEVELTAP